MSDPVTNVEIEDVLSSIRRLVTEGEKPHAAPQPQPQPENAAKTPPEKLVLTPALRVSPQDAAAQDEPAQPRESAPESEQRKDPWHTDAKLSDVGPVGVDVIDLSDTGKVDQKPKTADRASLEATIAELEAAVTAQPDEWEPDGSEMPASSGDWPLGVYSLRNKTEEAQELPQSADNSSGDNHLGTLVLDTPEPTFRHHADQDDVDTDYGDDLIGSADDTENDAELSAYLSDDAMIDEETLRELVRDVVRQELQGALGERITRNVRKLVRREIHRVLSSQEFD